MFDKIVFIFDLLNVFRRDTKMRDTEYARELASASIFWGESEGRIERLFVKEFQREEIRFSWWNEGRLIPRPLDLQEDDLIILMKTAIENGVFTNRFLTDLKSLLFPEV